MTTAALQENAVMERTEPLENYYRPKKFNEVWGNASAIKQIKEELATKGHKHTFLFTGGSGMGKTTLARIVAETVGAYEKLGGVIEVDGAQFSTKEDILELVASITYMPPAGNKAKVYIVDEVHAISTAAWQVFLKSSEEPPAHVYFIFLTTNEKKVPIAIKTRSRNIELKPLPAKTLYKYGNELICPLEGITLPEGVLMLIAEESGGSPRQFLNYLGQVRYVTSLQEARDLIVTSSADENDPTIQIARLLVNKCSSWSSYKGLLKEIENISSTKSVLKSYISKVALNSDDWQYYMVVLAAISEMDSFPDSVADLELMIWRVLRVMTGGK